MKFVDEAEINVAAGKGGDGSGSFRREKFVPLGGPDGGDGGRGGSVYLEGDSGLNTLADFRHKRSYKAANGDSGRGRQMYGKGGEDVTIRVPLGTIVINTETDERIGDVTEHGQRMLVAKGGKGGLGNVHFKSSTNRSPRQTVPGTAGEARVLHLELKVLADVGLLGFPNAGKSTLISNVSAARPKVADYPFTTLHPNLGVVRVGIDSSFVIADIPGLIEGAAEGHGLGIQFLKHLQRTRLLLHLVDLAPTAMEPDLPLQVRKLEDEMRGYDESLIEKPRWLVFSKADLMPAEEAREMAESAIAALDWSGPWYLISSVSGDGTRELMGDVMNALEELDEIEAAKSKYEAEPEKENPARN